MTYVVKIQYGSIGVFARYAPDGVIDRPEADREVYSFGIASRF